MREHPKEKLAGEMPARKPLISHIDRWVSPMEAGLNVVGAALIVFMMLFTMAHIVGRYLFNSPIKGHVEIVEMVMAGVVFLGIAFTQKMGGHVRMELFVTRVLKGRVRLIVESFTLLVALFLFAMITVNSLEASVLYSIKMGDTTPMLFWPVWPSKLFIPVGSFFLSLRLVIEIFQRLSQAVVGVKRGEL
jgi:TRAP-type C4-dicarboxylate transport system permease small subunit